MTYQQLEQELFNSSVVYATAKALAAGSDVFFRTLKDNKAYDSSTNQHSLHQLISTAAHLIKNYDLCSFVPEEHRDLVKFVLSKPVIEAMNFGMTLAKKYGEDKTVEQAIKDIALEFLKTKIGNAFSR